MLPFAGESACSISARNSVEQGGSQLPEGRNSGGQKERIVQRPVEWRSRLLVSTLLHDCVGVLLKIILLYSPFLVPFSILGKFSIVSSYLSELFAVLSTTSGAYAIPKRECLPSASRVREPFFATVFCRVIRGSACLVGSPAVVWTSG